MAQWHKTTCVPCTKMRRGVPGIFKKMRSVQNSANYDTEVGTEVKGNNKP